MSEMKEAQDYLLGRSSGDHSDHLRDLSKIAARSGKAFYRMVGIAYTLLTDETWQASMELSKDDVIAKLEAAYFYNAAAPLPTLLQCYNCFPEEKWRDRRFNALAMCALLETAAAEAAEEEGVKKPRHRKVVSRQEFEELKAQLATVTAENTRLREEVATKDHTIAELNRTIGSLSRGKELVPA